MRRCRDGGGGILYTYEPIQQITRDQSAAAPQSFSRIEIVKTLLSLPSQDFFGQVFSAGFISPLERGPWGM